MNLLRALIHSLLLLTTPLLIAAPQDTMLRSDYAEKFFLWNYQLTYDDLLDLFHDIESGDIEYKCPPEDWERIVQFIVAIVLMGVLPGEDSTELERDCEALLRGDDAYFDSWQDEEEKILPAFFREGHRFVLCKTWLGKRIHVTGKFFKKHKKAAIITSAIAVGVVAAVVIASAAGVGAATSVAAAAAGSHDKHKSSPQPAPVLMPSATPLIDAAIQQEILSFKKTASEERLFETPKFALEESGRSLSSVFAHQGFSEFTNAMSDSPRFAQEMQSLHRHHFPRQEDRGHLGIDEKFSTQYTPWYVSKQSPSDLSTLSHLARGEQAMASGHLHEAIGDFTRAIELDPSNYQAHLDRGIAYWGTGQYEKSMDDYHAFSEKDPLSVSDFSIGFAKKLPQGAWESGRGLIVFATEALTHPIQTCSQMWQALNVLSDLARGGEWEMLGEAVAPEVHDLVKDWDVLSSDKKGELAGYAFGKYGADILIPGAIAKVASRSARGAEELSGVYRNLKNAEKTLLLESAASMEGGAQLAEIMKLEGQVSKWLGDGAKCVRNKAGDPVFLSEDGLKKVRFDFKRPHPHESPHLHFERFVDGEWQEISRVYPIDVPHK